MGLFDFIFGRTPAKCEPLADRVWLTRAAKFKGIRSEVARQSESGVAGILLVAHFSDVFNDLARIAADGAGAIPVEASLVADLSTNVVSNWRLDESATIAIIAGERHPLPSQDERLLQFAEDVPCRSRMAFHVSLEDPLMKIFSGEWVENVLRQVMAEDEMIESQLVTRRIKAAQQKMERVATGDSAAESAAEWLRANT